MMLRAGRAMMRGAGSNVLVHCKGGLGRAGVIACRLLIELGMKPSEAIVAVRNVRPGAIETAAQLDYARIIIGDPGPVSFQSICQPIERNRLAVDTPPLGRRPTLPDQQHDTAFRTVLAQIVAHQLIAQPFAQFRAAPTFIEYLELDRHRSRYVAIQQPDVGPLPVRKFVLLCAAEELCAAPVEFSCH